jgi:hypothetical protein
VPVEATDIRARTGLAGGVAGTSDLELERSPQKQPMLLRRRLKL